MDKIVEFRDIGGAVEIAKWIRHQHIILTTASA